MKYLNLLEIQQVSAGVDLGQLLSSVAGATIGCAMASKYLIAVNVYWLGLIPIPVALAGGFVGGLVGHLIYDMDQYYASASPSRYY